MTDQFRTAFNNAIIEEEGAKGLSSTYLSDLRHQYILDRLDVLNNVKTKKVGKDYRLLKSYSKQTEIIQGIVVTQLTHPQSGLLFLAHSQLFDAIRGEHLLTGHGGRDIMHVKTKLRWAWQNEQFCYTCLLQNTIIFVSLYFLKKKNSI